MEFVSIIIVNYNGAHHLKDCLDSIQSLDYPKDMMELIFFDNGSTDDSIPLVKKLYPSAVIIENPVNIGFAAPHSIAAKTARGDVLALVNNDMKVHPGWIKEGISLLNPGEGVVCSSSKILSWNGKHVDFNGGSLHYLGYADQLKKDGAKKGENILFPCGGAMFVYKNIFLESGEFDGDYFAIFEDVDLGWRLWVMGYRVVMASDSMTYHKGHGTLDTKREEKKRFLMHRNALMTIIKNYNNENLKKILPLAFVLAVKRALLFMGVDKRDYYFWEGCVSKSSHPDSYEEGCLHLAVLDDVFSSFESLMRKRKTVQDSRKREDRDIFSLFRDPFRNIMGYKEYLWDEVALFGNFHLDELFQCRDDYKKGLNEGIYHAKKTLRELTEGIRGKTIKTALTIKPDRDIRSLAGKFYMNLKQNGLGTTLRKTGNYLLRLIK